MGIIKQLNEEIILKINDTIDQIDILQQKEEQNKIQKLEKI